MMASSGSGQRITNQNSSTSSHVAARPGIGVHDHVHQTPTSSIPNREFISLTHLRTGPRTQNEYVDSALSANKLPPSPTTPATVTIVKPLQNKKSRAIAENQSPQAQRFTSSSNSNSTATVGGVNLRVTTGSGSSGNSNISSFAGGRQARPILNNVVSKQPISNQNLKKLNINTPIELENPNATNHGDSVICSRCGKCKCAACRENRELPSWWLCGKKFEISAKSAVNMCTCVCCVKGIFYHYSKDYQQDSMDGMCSDEPCAGCERPHCLKRWACMALLSLCLPCLCIYWPAQCALVCCTACYNGCSHRGCKCPHPEGKTGSSSQTRRLIESDGSSA
ncbi:protein sprouty homolog 2-like [Argonauta hians]